LGPRRLKVVGHARSPAPIGREEGQLAEWTRLNNNV
jgi:hypothetical protein